MKKPASLLIVLLVFICASCKEVKDLLTFEISHSETFTLPARFVVPGVDFPGFPVAVSSNTAETFRNNNTRADLVKDVTLHKLVLTIQDPATEDFGFVKEIEIFIDADDADEVRLAYLQDVPATVGNTIELTSTNAKLDKYIKAETFTLRTRALVDETISQDVKIKTDMTFKVTADPL